MTATGLQHTLQAAAARLFLQPPTAPLAERIQTLEERPAVGRSHLAGLGQFNRGKSTLLNALLGKPLLPAGSDT